MYQLLQSGWLAVSGSRRSSCAGRSSGAGQQAQQRSGAAAARAGSAGSKVGGARGGCSFGSPVAVGKVGGALSVALFLLVELSRHLVRLRTGEDGWRICPASLVARVPGKLTLDRLM